MLIGGDEVFTTTIDSKQQLGKGLKMKKLMIWEVITFVTTIASFSLMSKDEAATFVAVICSFVALFAMLIAVCAALGEDDELAMSGITGCLANWATAWIVICFTENSIVCHSVAVVLVVLVTASLAKSLRLSQWKVFASIVVEAGAIVVGLNTVEKLMA